MQSRDAHRSFMLVLLTIMLMVSASCLPSNKVKHINATNIKFVSLERNSFESLQAVYASGNVFFNVTSRVQSHSPLSWHEKESSASYIISTILMTEMGVSGQPTKTLSQLVLPGKYLDERMIPDMEERIIHSSKDMALMMRKSELMDLADIYYAIICDLTQRLDIQSKFNQGLASVIYHKSIVKAAKRLVTGVSPNKVCPAYKAYEHQGLFACQQEYALHATEVKKVIGSHLIQCKDASCMHSLKSILGIDYTRKEFGDVADPSIEEAIEIKEDIQSLGNNTKLAEEVARLIACGDVNCKEPGCNSWLYTDGWFIYGADWGCCGDYPDCCFLSTEVCLVHDAICTCCSYPDFCLDPFCKPDPWCTNTTTTAAP